MPELTLHLLGPPLVELEGQAVQLGRHKAVALLAYLALTRQPHTRDALATLLWPDLDQSAARGQLRRTLSLLTFATIMIGGPVIGLLAAIVHAEDGSIVDLGLLAASSSLGAFAGAAFAGIRSAGANPTRRYAILGLASATAVALFALLPVGFNAMAPLAVGGAAVLGLLSEAFGARTDITACFFPSPGNCER